MNLDDIPEAEKKENTTYHERGELISQVIIALAERPVCLEALRILMRDPEKK